MSTERQPGRCSECDIVATVLQAYYLGRFPDAFLISGDSLSAVLEC